MTSEKARAAGTGHHASRLRNTIGGVIGNVMEWYDFAVFGFFAPFFAGQFFPEHDPTAALINAFGIFAAGYLMRPLGGVLFGHLGDRLGRKRALLLSIVLMGTSTTVMGLLPTHAAIGLAAPILLVALRLVQGISVGGELTGSISYVTETAPKGRRGLFGSLTLLSASSGVLIGSLIATLMSTAFAAEQLQSFGWRVPFIAGSLIALFGLWMRSGIDESPEFARTREAGEVVKNPMAEALRTARWRIVALFLALSLFGAAFYVFFVWWPTYLGHILKPPVGHGLLINTLAMTAMILVSPLAGLLSDRIGATRVYMLTTIALILIAYPLFVLTDYSIFLYALIGQLVAGVVMAGTQGSVPSLMAELFPTKTRYSSIGLAYNLAAGIFGGTAPLVATALITSTGDLAAPAFYLIAVGVVSLVFTLLLSRTRGERH